MRYEYVTWLNVAVIGRVIQYFIAGIRSFVDKMEFEVALGSINKHTFLCRVSFCMACVSVCVRVRHACYVKGI